MLAVALAGNASAATIKVCPDADRCFTSIQAAIDAAGSGDKIKIAAGTYQGSLLINEDITLDGAGAGQTTISADADKRVIAIAAGSSVLIKGVTVSGGNINANCLVDPDVDPYADGGGIFNRGSLKLFDTSVSANAATKGGGIYNEGTLTVRKSDVTGNRAHGGCGFDIGVGAGIFNTSSGLVTLSTSSVSGNVAGFGNGGIYNDGTLTVDRSAVNDNVGFEIVGGIGNFGSMTLSDSSVSRNWAQRIGGIGNFGDLTIRHSLVSDNTAFGIGDSGGISNRGTLTMYKSTVSGNTAYDVAGGISNVGTLILHQSTVSNNSTEVGDGGGIYNRNSAELHGTTVSGNTASHGGGIFNAGALALHETTVSTNTATCTGGGIYSVATVLLFDSTISGNTPNDRVDAAPGTFGPCV